MNFVREEAQEIADLVLGRESTERTGRALEGKSHKPDQTKPKVKINTDAGQEAPRTPARCICCEKGHNVDECEWLRAKPEKERADYVRENSLCLACLRGGHLAKSCKRRKFCKTCKARHPTPCTGGPLVERRWRRPTRKTPRSRARATIRPDLIMNKVRLNRRRGTRGERTGTTGPTGYQSSP